MGLGLSRTSRNSEKIVRRKQESRDTGPDALQITIEMSLPMPNSWRDI